MKNKSSKVGHCITCGKLICKSADKCPSCGASYPCMEESTKEITAFFSVLFIIFVIACILSTL